MALKVGELAKRSGLTVRTLHHYDEIGLLSPSSRSRSKHRLYSDADVERLQRIISLRQLGMSLERVGEVLDQPGCTLESVLSEQIRQMRGRIEVEQDLCTKLEGVTKLLRSAGKVSVDALLELMERIMEAEKHFTPEQLEYLKQRREALGDDHIRSVENEWPVLIGKVKEAMEADVDPSAAEVKALAKRWQELVREFTGGNAGVTQSLNRMYSQNLDSASGHMGIDRAMSDYVGRAMAALKSE